MGSLGSGQIGEMGGNYSLSCFSEFAHSTSVGAAGINSRTEIIHKNINLSAEQGCVCVEEEAWMNAWLVFFHDFKENTGFVHKEQNHSPQALERKKRLCPLLYVGFSTLNELAYSYPECSSSVPAVVSVLKLPQSKPVQMIRSTSANSISSISVACRYLQHLNCFF